MPASAILIRLFGLLILLLEGCLFWAVYRAHWEMRRYLCL